MAQVPVEVVVSVQDRFSTDLRRAGESTNQFAKNLRETQQVTSALTQDLLTRFSPALSATVVQIGAVARETRGLSPAFTAGAVGITAAVAVLTHFIDKGQEAVQMAARLSTAARSADLGALRGVMRESVAALELQRKQMEDFSGFLGKLGQGNVGGAISSLVSGFKAWTTDTKELANNLNAAGGELARLIPLEAERAAIQTRLKSLQSDQQARQTQFGIADRSFDNVAFETRAAQLRSVQTEIFSAQEALAELEAKLREIEARARKAPAAEIAAIRKQLQDEVKAIGDAANAAFAGLDDRLGQSRGARAERDILFGLPINQRFDEPGSLSPSAIPDVGRELRADQARALADIVRLQSESISLTRAEREAVALQVIEAERLLAIEEAGGKVLEINLANRRAALQSGNVQRERDLRLDPALGLQEGFRQAQEEMEESGRAMYEIARRTARDMQSAFSDHFFNVFTGQAKSLPNLFKGLGQSIVRSIADEFARQTTAPIIGLIRQGLGGGGGGLGQLGFSQGPVAIGAPGAGGIPGAINVSGMPAGQVQALSQQGYTITTSSAGPVAVPSAGSGTGRLGQAFASVGSSIRAFWNTPIFGSPQTARDYQQLASQSTSQEQAAFLEANTPGESGQYVGAGGQTGFTYGQGVGVGLQTAAFGYQAFQGFTDPNQDPSTESVAFGTLGATAQGAQIGGYFGGYGAAIGAVIGFVVGLASSSKTGENVFADKRRRKRLSDAAQVFQAVYDQINSAMDREEAASLPVPTQEGVGLTVGQLLASIAAHNVSGDFAQWSWPPDELARKVLTFLMGLRIGPREFNNTKRGISNTVELVANWGAQERKDGRPRNDPIEGAQNAKRLLEFFWQKRSRVYIQFAEDIDRGAARGSARQVTRTTVLNYERRAEAAGQDISILAESWDGLDDDKKRRVLEALMKFDRDHDIGAFRTERDGGAQVSVGIGTINGTGPATQPRPAATL